jgi:hypothetical protein
MSGSIQVGGTKKGPANLQIGYYNSEDTFVQLTTYTIAKNKTMYTVEFTLPTALENQSSVTIYVKLVNTTNIGGNEMTSAAYNTGGELAFNNFIVNGEKEAVVTTEETTTEAAQVETTTVEEQIETTTEPEQVETTTVEEQIETTTEPEQIETTAENAGDSVTTRIVEPTKDSSKVSPDVKKVVVKSTKIVKAKRSKNNKKISLKLKKVSGATGYKIKYSVNSNMKKSVTKTVKKTKVTLKKLNKKKKYYIQVCAYIKKSGNVYQSAWSTKKSVKRK